MRISQIGAPASMVPAVPTAFAGGVGVLQTCADLPTAPWLWLAAGVGVAIATILAARALERSESGRGLRVVAVCLATGLAGFGYAAWRAETRLADALAPEWEGRDVAIVGVVDDLPDVSPRGVRFAFAVERVETPDAIVPSRVSLSWMAAGEVEARARALRGEMREGAARAHPTATGPDIEARDDAPEVAAGERWRLVVRLKRPHGYANPGGFDLEAWLLERNLRATGYVRTSGGNERLDRFAARARDFVQRARERVRTRIAAALEGDPHAGVVTALAIGDQRAITDAQWTVFNRTGVGHLVSVSGLHVTALAALAAFAVARIARWSVRLTDLLPARSVGAIAGVVAAGVYTLLAGAEVPALRTFAMLATGACALLLLQQGSFAVAWAWALAAVLLLDPWAVLAPGFWLSYGAVAVLIYAGAGRVTPDRPASWRARAAMTLREGARTQWAVTVGLVPFALALFGQVSVVSPVANAVAIPVVTFAVVPFAVAGIFLPFDACFHAAHVFLVPLMAFLSALAAMPGAAWVQHAPAGWTLAAAAVGVLWLLAPRGVPGRALGALWLAPLALVTPEPPPAGVARITVLDVGQGLSVVVRTRSRTLVYDTGPGWTEIADAGSRIVAPFLRREGVARVDALVVSHGDADHAGGAASLLAMVPVSRMLSSLAADHPSWSSPLPDDFRGERCVAGMHWSWDGVDFDLLHPPPARYDDPRVKANDLSCVLRVRTAGARVLLAGDVEARSEAWLLATDRDALRADAIVVPHHGSRTSSTRAFVAAVDPVLAVIASGYRNRFGHPRSEVVARYVGRGAAIARTDRDGAVAFDAGADGLSAVARTRAADARYWRERSPFPEGSRGAAASTRARSSRVEIPEV